MRFTSVVAAGAYAMTAAAQDASSSVADLTSSAADLTSSIAAITSAVASATASASPSTTWSMDPAQKSMTNCIDACKFIPVLTSSLHVVALPKVKICGKSVTRPPRKPHD